ncbi:MAG: transcriptional regulator [Planctomycetota bacterium]|nr:MAG: transcriptional regulator [Planctomycetota bacterium]
MMVPRDKSEARTAPRGDDHPASAAAMVESILGCKWSVRILRLLAASARRPSSLLRACPGLTPKVMNERLQKLMRFGIIRRTVHGEKPPVRVEYALTELGARFMRVLDEVERLQVAMDRSCEGEGEQRR